MNFEVSFGSSGSSPFRTFSLVLVVNHACNLRCTYCYTGQKFNRRMPDAIARRAIASAVASIEQGGTLQLGFFGGEPLLEADRILAWMEYANQVAAEKQISVAFDLTTNGTIDSVAAWQVLLSPTTRVCISCDGDADTQDLHRRTGAGEGTSSVVMRTIERLNNAAKDFAVVTVVRPDTLDALPRNVAFLHEHGVREINLSLDLWTTWRRADLIRLRAALASAADYWHSTLPLHEPRSSRREGVLPKSRAVLLDAPSTGGESILKHPIAGRSISSPPEGERIKVRGRATEYQSGGAFRVRTPNPSPLSSPLPKGRGCVHIRYDFALLAAEHPLTLTDKCECEPLSWQHAREEAHSKFSPSLRTQPLRSLENDLQFVNQGKPAGLPHQVFDGGAALPCRPFLRTTAPLAINWFDSKLGAFMKMPTCGATTRCGFGVGEIAVAPSGNLYPCERLVGEDRDDNPMKVFGHVSDARDFLNIESAPERGHAACNSCTLNTTCNTSCRCSNYVRTGDVSRPDGLLCALDKICAEQVRRVVQRGKDDVERVS